MAPEMITASRSARTPIPFHTVNRDLVASLCLDVVQLALLLSRAPSYETGAAALMDGWAGVAREILADADLTDGQKAHARRIATQAIRSIQGYEQAARDKAFQVAREHMESSQGLNRPLTDEEGTALNNALYYANAARATYLEHVAGAVSGRRS